MNWSLEDLISLIREVKKKRWTGKITLNCHDGAVKVKREMEVKPVETVSLDMK